MQALNPIEPTTLEEMWKVAQFYAKSGMFPGLNSPEKAFVAIQGGRAYGFGAFASMSGLQVIHGRPEMSAGMMAARLKQYQDGKYNFKIQRLDNQACEIQFYENGEPVYLSKFTVEDAERAGLTSNRMWRNYSRNMLFARALSNGARWVAPDAFGGPVYISGEISGDGNGLSADGSETLEDVISDNAIETAGPDPRDIAAETFPFDDSAKRTPWVEFYNDEVREIIMNKVSEMGYTEDNLTEAIGSALEEFGGNVAELWLAFCVYVAEDHARELAESAA